MRPEYSARPSPGGAAAAARCNSSVARGMAAAMVGSSPKMRARLATAPCSRAATMAAASVTAHAASTASRTIAGLNTPKAAAMTSPGTCPRQPPRLGK